MAVCTAPGRPQPPIREATNAGHPVLIEVDLAGARAVKRAMPEVTTVFLPRPAGRRWRAGCPGAAPKPST